MKGTNTTRLAIALLLLSAGAAACGPRPVVLPHAAAPTTQVSPSPSPSLTIFVPEEASGDKGSSKEGKDGGDGKQEGKDPKGSDPGSGAGSSPESPNPSPDASPSSSPEPPINDAHPFAICPVAEGTVKDNFAAPRDGHTHHGADILAPYGEPVLATFSGTIVNDKTKGGRVVKLKRDNGAYIEGKHLSENVEEGKVQTGDIIGYVGSLSVPGTFPHLHFEWHPEGKSAIDPFPYLSQVCPDTQSIAAP